MPLQEGYRSNARRTKPQKMQHPEILSSSNCIAFSSFSLHIAHYSVSTKKNGDGLRAESMNSQLSLKH